MTNNPPLIAVQPLQFNSIQAAQVSVTDACHSQPLIAMYINTAFGRS